MPIHIEATETDIAKVVLLPGDPQRAQYIAEKYFENPKRYTEYRCMFGYTGTYKGHPISVQATGMGTPSLSIVVEELIQLKAKTLIRLGTCGALSPNLQFSDIVIASAAHSTHDIFSQRFLNGCFSSAADFDLTCKLVEKSRSKNIPTHPGTILTSETFYEENFDLYKKFAQYGALAVEMEAYALFGLSAKNHVKAATVLTVSDILATLTRGSKEQIQKGVDRMIELTLETIAENYSMLTE